MKTVQTRFGIRVAATGAPPPPLPDTTLSELAAGMSEGSFSSFTVNGWTWGLIETGTVTSLAWSNKGYWDTHDNFAYHFGAGHSPTRGVHIRYNDATNTWEDYTPPGVPPIQGPKHSYEHIALQPRSGQKGKLYHWKKYSNVVERLDLETGSWDQIAVVPGSNFQVAGGLEWFPELYGGAGGLVHYDERAGVSTWEESSNTWIEYANQDTGLYHNFIEYLPDNGVVLFGGGNTDVPRTYSKAVFQIDGSGNITQRNDSPFPMGIYRKGIFIAVAGKRPTLFAYNDRVYEHNYSADTWADVGGHNLFQVGASTQWVTGIGIPAYGVVMFLIEKGTPLIQIYKLRTL